MAGRRVPRGFSFTEILFAVMILGIGFIMIAAMFPVAIHQTEANNQETIAASLGTNGADVLGKTAQILFPYNMPLAGSILSPTFGSAPTIPMLPATPPQTTETIPGQVWSLYDSRDTQFGNTHARALWQAVSKNLIEAGDPRFGWIALYKRDFIASGTPNTVPAPTSVVFAPYVQVIIFGVQSHNRSAYSPSDVNVVVPTPGLLMPQFSTGAVLTPPTASNPFSSIQFSSGIVSEGSYVVVSDDHNGGGSNGRIYRIGVQQGNVWQFLPGEGMSANDAALSNADVFIVGPGYDPSTRTIHGLSEAISVYTTYVAVPH